MLFKFSCFSFFGNLWLRKSYGQLCLSSKPFNSNQALFIKAYTFNVNLLWKYLSIHIYHPNIANAK